ncbi:FAD:protein FMN transferase [Ferrimonas sp. SCSIO 43195]|uniref:FAD:protein FMN transferase n=1 Tax=Ferrimonas sp. SCSIO 43195 TaxID=2822844 RepID=UPI002075A799|nr:FAD:protein FMN transferase [Ferrimonas sp. SCSIO 43195]USD38122.1 FAD:protein FMN transferase [Ferrimonas sp. SCSIO 43195]
MKLLPAVCALLALLSLTSSAAPQMRHIAGDTMGTTYTIQWRQHAPEHSPAQVLMAVQQQLEQINAGLSVFRPDSEISRVNQAPIGQPIAVSKDLASVVAIANRISTNTDGALDITLGPVIEFWGFGHRPRDLNHKNRGQLERARSHTGMEGFTLQQRTLTKLIAGLAFNPSAVAKGYGVDRVALVLDQLGIDHYLVEIGGEIKTRGQPEPGRDWQIAVTRPEKLSLALQQIVPLKNLSMATSGNYVNFIENNGVRLGHIIDPRSGYPSLSNTLSVTVIHPSCAIADAYATALMVLDAEHALTIAQQHALAVMIIEQSSTGPRSRFSESFAQLLGRH